MRKSPTFNETITCSVCLKPFRKTGNNQIYCADCKIVAIEATKKKHYLKTNPDAYKHSNSPEKCSVCNKPFSSSFAGIPYCNKHYLRMYTNGTLEPKKRKTNDYIINRTTVTMTTNHGIDFMFDAIYLDKVKKYSWCLSATGYLVANIKNKVTKLHRYILDASSDFVVDHINGNPKDNRLINLRLCSNAENAKNVSIQKNNKLGYPGIRKTKDGNFNARITHNRKEIHIGNYSTFEEAVSARKEAEIKYYGDFAPSLGSLKDF